MAGREKKPAPIKKQNLPVAVLKDGDPQTEPGEKPSVKTAAKTDPSTQLPQPPVKKSRKANTAKQPAIKKNLKIKFKAKTKNTKKLKLAKSLFKNNKHLDGKNVTIVKNGVKGIRKRGKAAKKAVSTDVKNEGEIEGEVTPKKEPKKRSKKQVVEADGAFTIDPKKIKVEVDDKNTMEDLLKNVENELQGEKKPAKKVTARKQPAKPRRLSPKKKTEAVKRKSGSQDNVIESLTKDFSMDPEAQNVINKLDLNVSKKIKKEVLKKRRHSIEKFPVEDGTEPTFEQPFAIFSRRSASPKTNKRNSRIRKSIDNAISKRLSPYSTRSDTPARLLRNGKHRKLKGSQQGLLEGIESEYKRRRKTSEISTDVLKFPEYLSESDSNFSMNSLAENGMSEAGDSVKEEGMMTKSDLLRKEILESIKTQTPTPEVSELQNLNIKSISTKFTAILKRSLSTETSQLNFDNGDEVKPKGEDAGFIDTNSNDVKPQLKALPSTTAAAPSNKDLKTDFACDPVKIKKEEEVIEKIASSPSYKVPEKSFILDQMKQIFNDSNDQDGEKKSSAKRNLKLSEEPAHETVSVAKFYGSDAEKIDAPETTEVEATEVEATEVETAESEIVPEAEPEIQPAQTDDKPELNISTEDDPDPVAIPEKLPEPELPEQVEIALDNEPEAKPPENVINLDDDILKRFRGNSAISISIKETTKGEVKKPVVAEPPLIKIEPKLPETVTEPEEEEPMEETVEEQPVEEEPVVEEPVEEEPVEEEPVEEEPVEELEKEQPELVNDFMEESQSEMIALENKIMEIEEKLEADSMEIPEIDTEEESPKRNERKTLLVKISKRSSTESQTKPDSEEIDGIDNAILETPENLAIKENILSALGLQSLKAAEEAKRDKQKPVIKNDEYTGTLKTVIKLNRNNDKKKGRNPLKMTLQKSKSRSSKDGDCDNLKSDGASGRSDGENACYKVMKESSTSVWRHGSNSSDTAGANRKSHYSNRSNMDGSSEQASDNDTPAGEGEGNSDAKALVIPEKASSFSIHPDRLCSDECAYCFGKFGLFDTPLHIAQIKSVERQDKILENEVNLMRDSCLCDACYRHVDRRSTGQFAIKSIKRTIPAESSVPRPNNCHVLECTAEGTNMLRRKWLIKMRKSINRIIKIDLDNPSLHSVPVCAEHYRAVEHLMVCALCKRRLARNHIHYLGSECDMLNSALQKEGIPVTLTDKPVVCKLCRYFSSLLLKPPSPISQSNTAAFFRQYRRKLLHFHDIEVMDEDEAEEPISVPVKEKSDKDENKEMKKKSKKPSKSASKLNLSDGCSTGSPPTVTDKTDQTCVPFNSENGESRASTPSDTVIDYETLVPNLSLECSSDVDETKTEVPQKPLYRKMQLPESVREAVEISKNIKLKKNNTAVERLGSNPSISVRQLFQGEEDLPLQAHIDFSAIKERTPEGWEKCACTIQYDTDTKHLWQELQKPYGNQSSFLRHLILLEKYFRNGDLTLSPNASHHAVNYSVSVQNRLRAYDNIPSTSVPMQPLTMLPFNQIKKSQSGIITTNREQAPLTSIINAANLPKNTPIPISQLNPNFLTQLSVRQKAPTVPPPGLISLQPGTNRPITLVNKGPQKIKVPIGKNWKPTLLPVTSAMNAADRRSSGLVQVISGGKPYHITIQDYNKMCQLKRTQEMRKIAELNKNKNDQGSSPNSLLKPVVPRKQKSVTITATKTSNQPSPAKDTNSFEITRETIATTVPTATMLKEIPKPITISKSVMVLPKIPKSLTVIPQTVPRKPLHPPSPTLSITSKPSTSKS